MKNLIVTLCLTLTGSLAMAKTPIRSVRGVFNELALKSGAQVVIDLNQSIKKGELVGFDDLNISKADKLQAREVLKAMQKNNFKVSLKGETFTVSNPKTSAHIKLIDFLSQRYEVNGVAISFNPEKPLEDNIRKMNRHFSKATVFDRFPMTLMEDAHALLPLALVVPGLIVGGGSALFIDAFAGKAVNDMKNMDPKTQKRIKEITEQYKSRADNCEADLGSARASTQNSLKELQSVRVVGKLIEELDAELQSEWFNGKDRIDYDKLGCEAVAEREDFSIGSAMGIYPYRVTGSLLSQACHEHDRLNNCFQELEEVMIDNDVHVNDLKGPDRFGPLEDVVEEYRELKAISR